MKNILKAAVTAIALATTVSVGAVQAGGPETAHGHRFGMTCWSEENFNAISDSVEARPFLVSILDSGNRLMMTIDNRGFIVVSIITPIDGEKCYIIGAPGALWIPENMPQEVIDFEGESAPFEPEGEEM